MGARSEVDGQRSTFKNRHKEKVMATNYTPFERQNMWTHAMEEWANVLTVNRKSVTVAGALRIAEPTQLHGHLTRAGAKPVGKRHVWNNGEVSYQRYSIPTF
jgi:methionine synthase II (cobalamin-independent)